MRPPNPWPRTAPPDSSLSIPALAYRVCLLSASLRTLDINAGYYPSTPSTTIRQRCLPRPSNARHFSSETGSSKRITAPLHAARFFSSSVYTHGRPRPHVPSLSGTTAATSRRFASTASVHEVSYTDIAPPPALAVGSTKPDGSKQLPWHWLHSVEADFDPENSRTFLFELRSIIKSAATKYDPQNRSRPQTDLRRHRQLDSNQIWQYYRQHAHKASLSIKARVLVANTLLDNIGRVSANKETQTSYKLLRFLAGCRIAAIASDCDVFLRSNSSRKPSIAAEFSLANLFIRALALKSQPSQALNLVEKTLLQLWPELSPRYKPTPGAELGRTELKVLADSLSTIADSYTFDIKCRPTPNEIRQSIQARPHFFADSQISEHILTSNEMPSGRRDPVKDCLAALLDSSFVFLFDHALFAAARTHLFRALVTMTDVTETLSPVVGTRPWNDRRILDLYMLCLRAHMLNGSKDVTLDLMDLSWVNDIAIPDRLLSRLIARTSDNIVGSRIEQIVCRLWNPPGRSRVAQSGALKNLSTPLVNTITLFWASRGRVDYIQVLTAELSRRHEPQSEGFKRTVDMEVAVARGDTGTLKALLSQEVDLRATKVDDLSPGMRLLDAQSLHRLLQCHSQNDDLEAAEDLFEQALHMRLSMPASSFNFLIGMHVRRTDIDGAVAVFDQMRILDVTPDKFTYTQLIHGFGLRRDPEGAAHALRAMVAAGLEPDRVAYTALLNSYVRAGLYAAAIDLFDWLQKHPDPAYRPTLETCNTMLKAYIADSLPIQDVLGFVASLRRSGLEPNARTFALMIQSACDAGFMDVAERLFTEAERQLPSPPDSPPGHGANLYHFTIMIHGYLRRYKHAAAKEYFDELRDRGLQPSAITWAVMISNYAKSDEEVNYKLACNLVMELMDDESNKAYRQTGWAVPALRLGLPFETMFAPLLNAQAKRGDPDETEQTMEQLLSTEAGVSLYTMTPLLDAYRKAGDVEKGLAFFYQLYDQILATVRTKPHRLYGFSKRATGDPTSDYADDQGKDRRGDVTSRNMLCLPISIVIDMLANAGRHEDIAAIWSRAQADGFGFDSDNWNHLAASMAQAGQLDQAMSVVNQVLYHDRPSRESHQERREQIRQQREEDAEADAMQALDTDRQSIDTDAHKYDRPYTLDPVTLNLLADPAKEHIPVAASSPSNPPNRRYQFRRDDDPYVEMPFDEEEMLASEDDSTFSEDGVEYPPLAEEEEQEVARPPVPRLKAGLDKSLTRPLVHNLIKLSPWFAHYNTMDAISRGMIAMDDRDKVIRINKKYPRASALLFDHESRISEIGADGREKRLGRSRYSSGRQS